MKSYQQLCGIARALDVIGDRWTLLILRDLLLGPMHFQEILASQKGLPTNLLADRLRSLAKHGLLERASEGKFAAYQLTAHGRTVEPILFALGSWGWSKTKPTKDLRPNLRWAIVSVKRRLRPRGTDFTVTLHSKDQGVFAVWEKNGEIGVEARAATAPDFTIKGPAAVILQALMEKDFTLENQPIINTMGKLDAWKNLLLALDPP